MLALNNLIMSSVLRFFAMFTVINMQLSVHTEHDFSQYQISYV